VNKTSSFKPEGGGGEGAVPVIPGPFIGGEPDHKKTKRMGMHELKEYMVFIEEQPIYYDKLTQLLPICTEKNNSYCI
jgi:hypothetical protein